jgi:hypothetical protein
MTNKDERVKWQKKEADESEPVQYDLEESSKQALLGEALSLTDLHMRATVPCTVHPLILLMPK